MRFSFFSTGILLLTVVGHLYLYRRLVWDTLSHRGWRFLGLLVLSALAASVILARKLTRSMPLEEATPLALVGYSWLGISLYLVLALLVFGGVGRVASLFRKKELLPPPAFVQAERRAFLSRAVAGSALLAGGGAASFGMWRAYTPTRVEEVVVRLPHLPRALEGYTIVQLTDVHVGPLIQRRFLDEVVSRTNALKPDAIVLTGDLVDGSPEELRHAVAAFGNLRARQGSFMVTGNHEYYSGYQRWVTAFSGLGMQVLQNRRVTLGDTQPGGASFDLLGVDDWSGAQRFGKGYDLEAASAGRDPSRASVLLAHQPANFEVAAQQGIGLQLSGHTHGGQLFPFTKLIGLQWDYVAGLYSLGSSKIYVSRGTGFWGPPLRVDSPPEITKIVLTA